MIKFKMPLLVKFNQNIFYTTSSEYEPNFKTIFLIDDYHDYCITHLVDKHYHQIYMTLLEYIFHKKRLELSPVIDPDYFWELRQ